MNTYSIKVALRGVTPMIWRRLRVRGNTSLANLHHIIQQAMGWDDEYLHSFHIYGEDYGIAYKGGLSLSHNAQQVFVDDFCFEVSDRCTYTYNFTANWLCDNRIEVIEQASKRTPWCVGGSGRQGDYRYYKTDEFAALIEVFDKVVTAGETTTIGELRPLVERYEAARFCRQSINKRLMESFPRLT